MTAGSIEKFTWSPEHAVWDVSTESRAWDEALHPRAPAGSAAGGQFMAYDEEKDTGTGYGKKGGDADVRALQQALNKLGFTDQNGKKLDVDGMLGPLTTSAVIRLQRSLGVKADGNVSPQLLARILKMKPGELKKGTLRPAGGKGGGSSGSDGDNKLRPAGKTGPAKEKTLQEVDRSADPKGTGRSDWSEIEHPRSPATGKFVGKTGGSYAEGVARSLGKFGKAGGGVEVGAEPAAARAGLDQLVDLMDDGTGEFAADKGVHYTYAAIDDVRNDPDGVLIVARDPSAGVAGALSMHRRYDEDTDLDHYYVEYTGATGMTDGAGSALAHAAAQVAARDGLPILGQAADASALAFWNKMGWSDDPMGVGTPDVLGWTPDQVREVASL